MVYIVYIVISLELFRVSKIHLRWLKPPDLDQSYAVVHLILSLFIFCVFCLSYYITFISFVIVINFKL